MPIRRLNRELVRATEERDTQKKPPRISPGMQSEIRIRRRESPAILGADDVSMPANRSRGFCAWQKKRPSKRAEEDVRQTELLRKTWKESGKVRGDRKLHDDLA
jgi:putative transposase